MSAVDVKGPAGEALAHGPRLRPAAVVPWLALAAVALAFALTTSGFLSVDNGKAILVGAAFAGVLAVGQTPIMLGGALFSLSIGTTAAVTAMVFMSSLDMGLVPAMLVAILAGVLICALQGLVVGAWGANVIIVTIAAGVVQQGLATWRTGGRTVYPAGGADINFLREPLLGIPFAFLVLVAAAVLVQLLLRRTRFGLELQLLGENRDAARVAGLSSGALTTGAFAIAGACAGLTGILLAAFNQNATLNIEGTYTFDAIAALLVGGAAVSGGRASAIRSALGALAISALTSLLLLRGWSTGAQLAAKGVIVLATVVLLRMLAQRRSA